MKHKLFASFFAAVTAATLCSTPALAHDGEEPPPSTVYGRVAPLGNGYAKTYVRLAPPSNTLTGRRPPLALGVEVSAEAMNSLPNENTMLVIDFPIRARETPFQYMMLDWNPQGHEPAGVYDKPHFDFHFYIQDLDEVMMIDPGPCSGLDCEDYDKAMKPVPAQFNPEGYINVGSVVPYMGNHLIDPTSPEFNGQPFTRTWLYGAYDGKITFYEPMITKDSLTSQPNQCSALKLAQEYDQTGYYPTSFCTEYDSKRKVYNVYIKDFVYRVAPASTLSLR